MMEIKRIESISDGHLIELSNQVQKEVERRFGFIGYTLTEINCYEKSERKASGKKQRGGTD